MKSSYEEDLKHMEIKVINLMSYLFSNNVIL